MLAELFDDWYRERKASLLALLVLFERGIMRTGFGPMDTTVQSARRCHSQLAELDNLRAIYGPGRCF
jgi:hypothetical protein